MLRKFGSIGLISSCVSKYKAFLSRGRIYWMGRGFCWVSRLEVICFVDMLVGIRLGYQGRELWCGGAASAVGCRCACKVILLICAQMFCDVLFIVDILER